MNFNQARFLISAAETRGCPPDTGHEVAFVGRSNAGKSSAINRICARRALARTSSTPGRTRLLNFFALDEDAKLRLVDLPGYGYAKAPKTEQAKWAELIERYLSTRASLAGLVLLADSRLALKPADEQLIGWARASELPTLVLLTKADKINRNAQSRAVATARSRLPANAEALSFSAVSELGLQAARDWIEARLMQTTE
ncbi:MAG: ribosome biogenesis GTP-binding protein YihA/YsxC [Gammaproteobacteria bacterium]